MSEAQGGERSSDDEAVRAALEWLAQRAGVDVEPDSLQRAVRDEARHPGAAREHALVRVLHSARSLQLGIHRVRAAVPTLREAGVARTLPWLTAPADGVGGRWIAVERARGGRFRVARWDGGGWRAETVSAKRLARALAPESPDAEIEWIAAHPEAPLAALRTPHDAHGGHAERPIARRVLALLRLERDDVSVVVAYAVAVGLLSLATPIAVQSLVNTVAFGTLLQPVAVLTALVFAVLAVAGLLRLLQVRVVERIQQRLFVRVALDLAYRLPRAQVEAFDRAYGPELVNRFFDVLTVQKFAAGFLLDGVGVILQAAIGMLVLAVYHPVLLGFDLVLLIAIAVVVFALGAGAPRTAVAESKAKYAVAAWLEELARQGAPFRDDAGGRFAAAQADALARGYLHARRAHFRVLQRQVAGALVVQVVASAALLGLGGWLVIARQLTLGQLVASELIVSTVVAGLAKFGKQLEGVYDLFAALDKLSHLVDLPLEAALGERGRRAGGAARVRVAGASYRFEGGREAFGPVEFTAEPGARLGVAGGASSGKSTLAEVLAGVRLPTEGAVEVDGVDTRVADARALRSRVALLRRDDEPFEASVYDNLALGRTEVDAGAARGALAAVGLERVVRALPHEGDTVLAPRGAPLSETERRLLVVARALARRPALIVMDESFADVEPAVRDRVLDAVFARGAPWTVIALLPPGDEALARCDRVYALPPPRAAGAENGARGGAA